jgi:hypothetical protein
VEFIGTQLVENKDNDVSFGALPAERGRIQENRWPYDR